MHRRRRPGREREYDMAPGTLYGIGVGPGDPELITVKAVRLINQVDVVFAPTKNSLEASQAYRVVKPHLREGARVEPLVFPMTYDRKVLEEVWAAHAGRLCAVLEDERDVGFITLGDPMTYSTYTYIFTLVRRRRVPVEHVPGITSYGAMASALGIPLVEGDENLLILPANYPGEKYDLLLPHADNVVFMKFPRDCGALVEKIGRHGLADKTVFTQNLGLEGERLGLSLEAARLEDKRQRYLSLMLSKRNLDRYRNHRP